MAGQINLSGLQLIANALALPARVREANAQAGVERAFLEANAPALGISPDQLDLYAPKANLPGPMLSGLNNRLGGIPGKILGPVGEVGSILSSLLGGPLSGQPPRVPLANLSTLAQLKGAHRKEEATDAFAGTMTNPAAKAAARAGSIPTAYKIEHPGSGGGTGELPQLIQSFKDRGASDVDARRMGLEQFNSQKTARSLEVGRGMSGIRVEETARKERSSMQRAVRRSRNLLGKLKGAVDRQLHADSMLGRLTQAGKIGAFKQGLLPAAALGLTPEQEGQFAEDIATLDSPQAFAGSMLEGFGEKGAGRLSDFDIKRVLSALPTGWDTRVMAQARLQVLDDLAKGMAAAPPAGPDEDPTAYGEQLADVAERRLRMIQMGRGASAGTVDVGRARAVPTIDEDALRKALDAAGVPP
jgi:hypothetical protein